VARYATARDDDLLWVAVAPDRPCPVCGGVRSCGIAADDGFVVCGIAADDGFVVCGRVASPHPVDVGGWLHSLPVPEGRSAPAGAGR